MNIYAAVAGSEGYIRRGVSMNIPEAMIFLRVHLLPKEVLI